MAGSLLHCPIRGALTVSEKAADGLTYTEEKRRIDCIRFLLAKGYPASHFKIETVLHRFGHKGRNSFRTDLAILDAPASSLPGDLEALKPHIKLIAEIKRGNEDAKSAKQTQVIPAMDFAQDLAVFGIYWDDVEQRLFYKTVSGTKTAVKEAPIAVLPSWGQSLGSTSLRSSDLRPSTNLRAVFEKIDDILHAGAVTDKSKRFDVMLKLILVKLYDENTHQKKQTEMEIQDYTDSPLGEKDVVKQFDAVLAKAVKFYGKYLPKPVTPSFGIGGGVLKEISAVLAPIQVLGSKRDVIQDFYMYFAQGVYKWDLAQYFTPAEVVDFIVALVNPQAGDTVKDPACGSGDFLISSLHYALANGADIRDAIWGSDNSENAVQVCILNMVLNGDGKSNIKHEDSLENLNDDLDTYSVMLCNPPFGVKIVEKRFDVLSSFDLGHDWKLEGDTWQKTDKVSKSVETGLLFAELCVRQASENGRVGIILPNGYLGNRSPRYLAFREWLLRYTRLIGVVAFPRFTFKKSGADVSASVLVLEKRETPLLRARDSEDYPFFVGLIESVGWKLGDKKAERIYKREPDTGAFVTSKENNEPVPDADFERVLREFWGSKVADVFPWVTEGLDLPKKLPRGWTVSIKNVLGRTDLSIDPKRWSERASAVRKQISALPHFKLSEILMVVPEGKKIKDLSGQYEYVEITDVSDGIITPTKLRGWELPTRARHRADKGDVFIGSIWGSVGKWFIAGNDCDDLVVSNGLHRLKIKKGKEDFLVDLIAGLNTEAYRIQARAFATGSDGLAELSPDDVLDIVLPKVQDKAARQLIEEKIEPLLEGRPTVASVIDNLQQSGTVPKVAVSVRSTNWVQV